jgi:hypothetical protein
MRLASYLRIMAYPAVLVLISFVFTGGASAQALKQTPAAKYIGVDAYSAPAWAQVGESGSKYYAGSPKSEKFFYQKGLPDSDADATSNHVPGCGAKKPHGGYVYPASTLCIIAYNAVTSTSDTNLRDFLKSTVGDRHQIMLVFCNEPENGNQDNGCMCDFGQEELCKNPGKFITEFETESDEVAKFEQAKNKSNVKFAEDSWKGHYESGTGGCKFIVPSQYVSYYLVDVYEGRSTKTSKPITKPESLGQDPGWKNWISCTSGNGVPHGIAEFAINCGNEKKSLDKRKYEEAVAASFGDDDTYLKANFPDLEVWNLWDSGGCALDNKTKDEPDSIAAWRRIESGN